MLSFLLVFPSLFRRQFEGLMATLKASIFPSSSLSFFSVLCCLYKLVLFPSRISPINSFSWLLFPHSSSLIFFFLFIILFFPSLLFLTSFILSFYCFFFFIPPSIIIHIPPPFVIHFIFFLSSSSFISKPIHSPLHLLSPSPSLSMPFPFSFLSLLMHPYPFFPSSLSFTSFIHLLLCLPPIPFFSNF